MLTSKEDFDKFVKYNMGYVPYFGDVDSHLSEPAKYPCVLLWTIKNNDNGAEYITGDYVYLDDFSEVKDSFIDKAVEWLNRNFNMPVDFRKHFVEAMKEI